QPLSRYLDREIEGNVVAWPERGMVPFKVSHDDNWFNHPVDPGVQMAAGSTEVLPELTAINRTGIERSTEEVAQLTALRDALTAANGALAVARTRAGELANAIVAAINGGLETTMEFDSSTGQKATSLFRRLELTLTKAEGILAVDIS